MANLLHRIEGGTSLQPAQLVMDQIDKEAQRQMGDLRATLPLLFAGAAFRLGRLGVLTAGSGISGTSAVTIRGLSYAAGLGVEVSAYELSHRALGGGLWKWEGPEGIKSGLLASVITFGLLRGSGHLARHQNIFLQHFFQDVSTLAGQDLAASAGYLSVSEESYVQRLMQIEITNNQMMASLRLYGHVLPGAARSEKMWDAMLESHGSKATPFSKQDFSESLSIFASQISGAKSRPSAETFREALQFIDWLGNFAWTSRMQSFRQTIERLERQSSYEGEDYNFGEFVIKPLAGFQKIRQLYGSDSFVLDQVEKHFGDWNMIGPDPYREVRFSPEAQEARLIFYPEPMRRVWSTLGEALSRARQALVEGASVEEIYAHRMDENQVNRIWFFQLMQFAQEMGARVSLLYPESLLKSFEKEGEILPDAKLKTVLQRLEQKGLSEEAFHVMELVIPCSEIIFGWDRYYVNNAFLTGFLMRMAGVLGKHLSIVDPNLIPEAPIIFRIPSPSLLEAMLQELSPVNAPRFFYIPGEVDRPLMMKARELGLALIGISQQPIILGDVNVSVPPWVFTIHDIFHAYMSASSSPDFKRFVMQHARVLAQQSWAGSAQGKDYMGQLLDMTFPQEVFFGRSLSFMQTEIDIAIQRGEINHEFFGQRLKFLDQYQEFVERQEAQDPGHAAYYVQVKGAVQHWKAAFHRQQNTYRWLGLVPLRVSRYWARRFR